LEGPSTVIGKPSQDDAVIKKEGAGIKIPPTKNTLHLRKRGKKGPPRCTSRSKANRKPGILGNVVDAGLSYSGSEAGGKRAKNDHYGLARSGEVAALRK